MIGIAAVKVVEALGSGRQGRWVGIVELAEVTGLDMAGFAEAFEELMESDAFRAEPEPFNWRVGPREAELAPVIGEEARHRVWLS